MYSSSLKNKNVIITGCNKGIGKATLEDFAKYGANIFACARTTSSEFKKFIIDLKKKYRVRLLVRGPKSMKVQHSIAKIIPKYKFSSGIKLSVDVDPINFN